VDTKRFNEQVRRNAAKFPVDFMFPLTAEEFGALRSQFATLNPATAGSQRGICGPNIHIAERSPMPYYYSLCKEARDVRGNDH